ncbi:MAG TPA: response regulator [Segetibacter sp.]
MKHFLIADDDADDRYLFQNAITEMNQEITLTLARDCDELIKLLEEFPSPDAIILDINMRPTPGKECLTQIRSKKELNKVPVVMLTTSSDQMDIDDCLSIGADNYFVKPSTYKDLQSLIKKLCDMGN